MTNITRKTTKNVVSIIIPFIIIFYIALILIAAFNGEDFYVEGYLAFFCFNFFFTLFYIQAIFFIIQESYIIEYIVVVAISAVLTLAFFAYNGKNLGM